MGVVTVEHLLRHFAETPAGKKIAADITAAAIKEREPLLAELQRIQAHAAKEAPALRAAAAAALQKERDAERAWRAAQNERWIADTDGDLAVVFD